MNIIKRFFRKRQKNEETTWQRDSIGYTPRIKKRSKRADLIVSREDFSSQGTSHSSRRRVPLKNKKNNENPYRRLDSINNNLISKSRPPKAASKISDYNIYEKHGVNNKKSNKNSLYQTTSKSKFIPFC